MLKTQRLMPQVAGANSTKASRGRIIARKSTGCVLHDEEVPRYRDRKTKLVQVDERQMQPSKISRYEDGDSFGPHTDATSPPDWRGGVYSDSDVFSDLPRARLGTSFCQHPGANVVATVFVYLNDVPRGGRTRWRYTPSDPAFYDRPSCGA